MLTIGRLLDDFLTYLADVRGVAPNTLAAHRSDLRQAAAALTAPLADLTCTQIEAFLGSRKASPATQARRAATLRRFFNWAQREYPGLPNPLDQVEPVTLDRRLPRPVRSREERATIDQAIAGAPQPYRLMLTILRETGMRGDEVLQLQLGDVLLDAGREGLRVQEPKNNAERIVVLTPGATPKTLRGLRAHVKTLKGHPSHVPLFRSNRGGRVSYHALRYQWVQLCRATGLANDQGQPHYTLHQLRHTRGTEMIEEGHSLEITQRVLGHRDPRSTLGYAELNDQQVRAALEKRRRG
jgi:site-specific recombinase XerD